MAQTQQAREIRKQILYSYFHKAVLLVLAVGGFFSLIWLGQQKETFDKEKKVSVSDDVKQVVRNAAGVYVGDPLLTPGCDNFDEERTYDTREELIAVMQARAETCVWAGFRATIENARAKMAKLRHKRPFTAKVQKDYDRYADIIQREQSFAATKVQAARLYVGTMLQSRDLSKPKQQTNAEPGETPQKTSVVKAGFLGSIRAWAGKTLRAFTEARLIGDGFKHEIQPTLSDKSSSHVIYQILWYASLLLGIGASSMLFVLILTAIPITNGEGYWSSRMSKLLENFPSVSNRSFAVPLLAAAIGGGTLAGAAASTEVGGQAHLSEERSTTISAPAWIDSWSLVYTDAHTNLPPVTPPYTELKDIAKAVDGVGSKAESLTNEVKTTGAKIADSLKKVSTSIDTLAKATQEFNLRVDIMQQNADNSRADTGEVLACLNDLKSGVGNLQEGFSGYVADSNNFSKEVSRREIAQETTVAESLAQGTERDPRNPLLRTFGLTLFQVGPSVITEMAARFGGVEKAGPKEQVLLEALKRMREEDLQNEQHATCPDHGTGSTKKYCGPLNRWTFEKRLRAELWSALGNEDDVYFLMKRHFPALLRICALPR